MFQKNQNSTEETPFRPPNHEIEALARCLFPTIREYFESEEGQREFAEWKAKRKSEKQSH